MKFSRSECIVLALGLLIPATGWYLGTMMNIDGWASLDGNIINAPWAVALLFLPVMASCSFVGPVVSSVFALLFYVSYRKGKKFLIATWYLFMVAYAVGMFYTVASASDKMFAF